MVINELFWTPICGLSLGVLCHPGGLSGAGQSRRALLPAECKSGRVSPFSPELRVFYSNGCWSQPLCPWVKPSTMPTPEMSLSWSRAPLFACGAIVSVFLVGTATLLLFTKSSHLCLSVTLVPSAVPTGCAVGPAHLPFLVWATQASEEGNTAPASHSSAPELEFVVCLDVTFLYGSPRHLGKSNPSVRLCSCLCPEVACLAFLFQHKFCLCQIPPPCC